MYGKFFSVVTPVVVLDWEIEVHLNNLPVVLEIH
jgi:hypothetical protein